MLPFRLSCSVLIFATTSSAAYGQSVGASPPTAEEHPRERVNRIFDELSPPPGEPLPDVTIYDAQGRKFPLRNLRGRHTVLLFGCLT